MARNGSRRSKAVGVADTAVGQLAKLLRRGELKGDQLKLACLKLRTLTRFASDREMAIGWLPSDVQEAARKLRPGG